MPRFESTGPHSRVLALPAGPWAKRRPLPQHCGDPGSWEVAMGGALRMLSDSPEEVGLAAQAFAGVVGTKGAVVAAKVGGPATLNRVCAASG